VRTFSRGLAALTLVASVVAGAALAAGSASVVTVKSTNALGAKILVNAHGLTLYHYMDESKGRIDCTGSCEKFWPPLLVPAGAKPAAGAGIVASKLGEIKRPDGKLQVTYFGLPLYLFAADTKAGQTKGQGFDHSWYAVTSAGSVTKATSATAKASSSSTASSSRNSGSSSSTSSSSPAPAPYNY